MANQLLEQLTNNGIKYIEQVFYSYKTKKYSCICKFPNGRVYVYTNALAENPQPDKVFKTVTEAEDFLLTDQSLYRQWENPEHESAAGNLNLTYITKFYLEADVNDFDKAKDFLVEYDMTKFLLEDQRISPSTRDKVIHIEWNLTDYNKGYIELKTNNYLTERESREISDWISGQNSDGLGESFSQRDFANYRIDDDYSYRYDDYDEYYDDDSDHYVTAYFDWQTNNYELTLQE